MPPSETTQQDQLFGSIKIGGNAVLSAPETFTHEQAPAFAEALEVLCSQKQTSVVLDCKKTAFMDSVALEHIIDAHNQLRALGGVFKIVSLNSVCRDILVVTRLVNVLNVYSDVPDALRSRT
jgi:anti-anti-sigma factor